MRITGPEKREPKSELDRLIDARIKEMADEMEAELQAIAHAVIAERGGLHPAAFKHGELALLTTAGLYCWVCGQVGDHDDAECDRRMANAKPLRGLSAFLNPSDDHNTTPKDRG